VIVDDLTAGVCGPSNGGQLAWWEANTMASPRPTSGRTELELALREVLSESRRVRVGAGRARRGAVDEPTDRQLTLLFHRMRPNQIPADLRRRSSSSRPRSRGLYATHRGEIDGERGDDNQIAAILTGSDDVDLRRRRGRRRSRSAPRSTTRCSSWCGSATNAARRSARPTVPARAPGNELDADRPLRHPAELESGDRRAVRAWKGAPRPEARRPGTGARSRTSGLGMRTTSSSRSRPAPVALDLDATSRTPI